MANPVMDPEVLEAAQTAVKGLTVMSLLPVAALALWSDYFERHIEGLKAEKADRDIDDELRMVRMAFLVGLIYQFLLYLSTSEVRDHYPIYTNVLFVVTLLGQMRLQTRVEFKVLPTPKVTSEELRPKNESEAAKPGHSVARGNITSSGAARAFLFTLISGGSYLAVLLGTLRVFTWIAISTQASPAVGAIWILAGAIIGILSGLGLAFALGPLQLKSLYPTAKLEDPEARERIEKCFENAGLKCPALWLIRSETGAGVPSTANAMIAGIPGARGSLGPALFISEKLLMSLNWDEIEAVVMHEISHLRLRHLRRRFTFAAGMLLGGILFSTLLITAVGMITKNGQAAVFTGTLTIFGGFIYALRQLGEQSRLHEIEADLEAIKMGSGPDSLIQALRKLDRMNGVPSDRIGSAHPATEERIGIIRKAFATRLADAIKKESKNQDKAA